MLNSQITAGDFTLLTQLIKNGDEVSITQGKLVIKPSSGLALTKSWLKQNETLLINDICRLLNIVPLRYISYTTGSYGAKKSQGITLQFSNLHSGDDAYIIFNANLTRSRTTNRAKKGDLLPGKQFIVSERSGFYKFWLSTRLPLPRSPSKFYECMGKLKLLTFTSPIDFNNRIKDKKLPLLEVSFQEILDKQSLFFSDKNSKKSTAKLPLKVRQETAKQPLAFTASETEQKHSHSGLASNQSACTSKYGNTVIRKEVLSTRASVDNTTINIINNKKVASKQNEENSQKKCPEDQTVDEWLEDWENAFTPEEFAEVMTDFSAK
jgi:hypothetical protein